MPKAIRGNYKIISVKNIAPDVFELRLHAPEIARDASAGQFVNIYLPDGAMLLPRPISIADSYDDELVLVFAVVGAGTKALSLMGSGEYIELMGPLGSGFFDYPDAEEFFRVLLIGGGAGVSPLRFAARELRRDNKSIAAFLGFAGKPWYTGEFYAVCDEVNIASETAGEASFHGNVIEMLDAEAGFDLALACGPRPMMAAAALWCAARDIPLRVSLEERMGCGYGVCAGCTVPLRLLNDAQKPQNGPSIKDPNGVTKKKACVHGPVFWADEVIW